MSKKSPANKAKTDFSRRHFLATTGAVAAATQAAANVVEAAVHQTDESAKGGAPAVPFETYRDYIQALDDNGLLAKFQDVDQDAYEGTAIMYRLRDEHGIERMPAVMFERIKIDGVWRDGPVFANEQGHWDCDTLLFGMTPVPGDSRASYRKARAYFLDMLAQNRGAYPTMAPNEIGRDQALCKQVVLTGDDIDLTQFAFFRNNPADIARYINTGSVFTRDPEMGINFGTYRCQLKGPRKIGVNSEPNQTGWKMFMAAKERGEKSMSVSIALGQDPVMSLVSSARVASRRGGGPIDELALVGGLRGKPLDVVRSETNDFLVPAHAEMVIEGEVPLDSFEPEGPYGEMYGYMGLAKTENFWMNVTSVTHRENPWISNNFTGVHRGNVKAPGDALSLSGWQRRVPEIVDIHTRGDATGVTFISIKKTKPGQGLEVGKKLAEVNPISKIILVVDDDMDVANKTDMLFALGSRWQPDPASYVYKQIRGLPLDPSSPERPMTSKIVIDATRQWPEEGGPDVYPGLNRTLLTEGAPEVFDVVDAKWGDQIKAVHRF